MAVAAIKGRSEQLQLPRKWKERENTTSPERTIVWSEPSSNKLKTNTTTIDRREVAPVVYYLSRNGQLEHPHFMEVSLSSPDGLFLRDVISRLNLLRGKGMASQYSWSSKRSYKNGYVWHDLEENDNIHPVHGGEYVIKGSEILDSFSSSSVSKSPETSSSSNSKINTGDSDFTARHRRRNQSWGAIAIDLNDSYKVYKAESARELKTAADASTQTEEKRRRKLLGEGGIRREKEEEQSAIELSKDEISPPPSDSSPETLESLMKADGRLVLSTSTSTQIQTAMVNESEEEGNNRTVGSCSSGRMKASSVLMSLISCGSISFRECGVTAVKEQAQNKDEEEDVMAEIESHASSSFAKMALEDKEYFSGSLIETNKDEFSALKRSSSYNADRNSHLKMGEKEEEGVKAKCIPRRPKTTQANIKKDLSNISVS